MAVIAVVNRKGGSGKSTVAAHLAAWCARQGHTVMLGDADPQQSIRAWLRRRAADLPAIAPLSLETRSMLRIPSGFDHVVLDTPGALQGFELARIVMCADAIVMPVSPSLFDRESAAGCLAEIRKLPRVAAGRCPLAVLGMRVDPRIDAAIHLQDWSASHGVSFLGALRETPLYVRMLEQGMTLFDLPPEPVEADLGQWDPVLQWLQPLLRPAAAASEPAHRHRGGRMHSVLGTRGLRAAP